MSELANIFVRQSLVSFQSNLSAIIDGIDSLAEALTQEIAKGSLIMVFGNGGSAADAQHLCGELMGRYRQTRPPIACVTLPDISSVSGISNDYSYEELVARTIQAYAHLDKFVIFLTTSGSSPNILRAAEYCRASSIRTACISRPRSAICDLCDICIMIDSDSSAIIQQLTMVILHGVCELVNL
jgi:D-sedoheptulose 7-phosphate isomerase